MNYRSSKITLTQPCLIAMDVDDTLVARGDRTSQHFRDVIAQQLIECVELGFTLVFVSGNTLEALKSRLLTPLLQFLEESGKLDALSSMHFISNGGGVHFTLANQKDRDDHDAGDAGLTTQTFDGIRWNLSHSFVQRNIIPDQEATQIEEVLWSVAGRLERTHLVSSIESRAYDNGSLSRAWKRPPVECRRVTVGDYVSGPLQISLHLGNAAHDEPPSHEVKRQLVRSVDHALARAHLDGYTPRLGGRASIDVARREATKATALRWLINQLGFQSEISDRLPDPVASVLYIGDELMNPYGNDFPVLEISELIAVSVNFDPEFPLHSRVLVDPDSQGPVATSKTLSLLLASTRRQMDSSDYSGTDTELRNAIQQFAVEQFAERSAASLQNMFSKDTLHHITWQEVHALLRRLDRHDTSAGALLHLFVEDIDRTPED